MRSLQLALLCVVALAATQASAEDKPYVIGLQPSLDESESLAEGHAIARYLSAELSHSVESRAFTSYDELADALAKHQIDLAWISPYAFVKASDKSRLTAIAKVIRHGESYRAVLFVRAESKVRRISDIKGARVAWVDHDSTAGYLFPAATLRKAGVDLATFFQTQTFAGSHRAVCEAVLSGAADVGATFHNGADLKDLRPDGCFASLGPRVGAQLRGIAATNPIPNEVIAVASDIDADVRLKFERAFLSMANSESGREVLRTAFHADGFAVPLPTDFDPVRVAIDALTAPPKTSDATKPAEQKPYVIGLEPALAEVLSLAEGHLLAKYLSTELQHAVESRTFESYDELANALATGEVDFAWISPYAFVKASRKAEVVPLVKALRHGDSYRAVFFVRASSKARSLADLKGLHIAYVDKDSAAGYLFPRDMLRKAGFDPDTFFSAQTFAGSHRGVCESVLSGASDVGVTFHYGSEQGDYRPDGCIVAFGAQGADPFNGIASSDRIPNEVIAASPALEKAFAQRIGQVFSRMSDTDDGQRLLRDVFHADGFGPAASSDFDNVREAAKLVDPAPEAPQDVGGLDRPYVFGLEPTLSNAESNAAGETLAKYLSAHLHHPVEARTFPSYDELAQALAHGDIDMGWINPYAFIMASREGNVVSLAKAVRGGDSYQSVLFVRDDSKARTLSALKGLKVAWVDPLSTAGYLFPRATLAAAHLDPNHVFKRQRFMGSHQAVCEAVLSGAADVGATFHTGNDPSDLRPDGCVVSLGTKAAERLVGIATSGPIPNEVIAASSTLPRDVGANVTRLFLGLSDSDAGREILRTAFHADAFHAVNDSDFDTARAAARAAAPTAAPAHGDTWVIGLEPTFGAAASAAAGKHLAKYLSDTLKRTVTSKTFASYDELADALRTGQVDFAWVNPYTYVKASANGDVTPLAKALRHGDSYRAVFFVKAGSPIHTLADLKGARIAWVDKSSTAGYLFPRKMLLEQHLDSDKLFKSQEFAGSHRAVCKAVVDGDADVGVTFHTSVDDKGLRPDGCFVTLGDKESQGLVGIAGSDRIPNEVIAAASGVDPAVALQMSGAFLSMSDTTDGQKVLSEVFNADGFAVPLENDFAPVRDAARALADPKAYTERPEEPITTPAVQVRFAAGSAELNSEALAALDRAVDLLRADPLVRMYVDGHDSTGEEQSGLSWQRAAAVRAYLTDAGVSMDRLITRGFGATRPAATNDTDAGRAANRRVELRVIPANLVTGGSAQFSAKCDHTVTRSSVTSYYAVFSLPGLTRRDLSSLSAYLCSGAQSPAQGEQNPPGWLPASVDCSGPLPLVTWGQNVAVSCGNDVSAQATVTLVAH